MLQLKAALKAIIAAQEHSAATASRRRVAVPATMIFQNGLDQYSGFHDGHDVSTA
jgi:hypothetical protein